MSYDLSFTGTLPSAAALASHFSGRPHYRVREGGAAHEHPLTGAYFSFSWSEGPEAYLSFNLNYSRPGWFAHPAEPEVAALIRAFDLGIDDPQNEGMGTGPYSREGFLRGWGWGNTWATGVMRQMGMVPPDGPALPADQNLAAWAWNHARDALQDHEDLAPCFVPLVLLLSAPKLSPLPLRAVAWTGDMPLALPEVDLIVTPKKVIRTEAIHEALGAWPLVELGLPDPALRGLALRHRRITEVPKSLKAALKGAGEPVPKPITRLDPSSVLDAP